MSEGIFETIEQVQSELKNNKEEVATEAVQIERKGSKAPSLINLSVAMDETMEVLAKHIAAYVKTLKGSDYYEHVRNIDIIDSERVWDPDHGVAVNLKTFEVATQDRFL